MDNIFTKFQHGCNADDGSTGGGESLHWSVCPASTVDPNPREMMPYALSRATGYIRADFTAFVAYQGLLAYALLKLDRLPQAELEASASYVLLCAVVGSSCFGVLPRAVDVQGLFHRGAKCDMAFQTTPGSRPKDMSGGSVDEDTSIMTPWKKFLEGVACAYVLVSIRGRDYHTENQEIARPLAGILLNHTKDPGIVSDTHIIMDNDEGVVVEFPASVQFSTGCRTRPHVVLTVSFSSATVLGYISESLIDLLPPPVKTDRTPHKSQARVIFADAGTNTLLDISKPDCTCLTDTFNTWVSRRGSDANRVAFYKRLKAVLEDSGCEDFLASREGRYYPEDEDTDTP